MNGKERFQTALSGGKSDHISMIFGNNNSFLCEFYNVTVDQLLDSPELYSDLAVRFVKEFEFDFVRPSPGYIFYGCGPELGIKWKFTENNFPAFFGSYIENKGESKRIELPDKPSGYFKKFLTIHSLLMERIGFEVYVRGSALGPFSIGCFLRGMESFLLDSIMNLNLFRHVMEISTSLSNYFVEQIFLTGTHDLVLNEVYLTPGNLSQRFYQEEVNPYLLSTLGSHPSKKIYFYQQNFMDTDVFPDGTQKRGLASAIYYGSKYGAKNKLEVIKQSAKLPIPGYPPLVTVSGTDLVNSTVQEILDYIRQSIDIMLENRICNPCIHLVSIQASSSKEALEIADKINYVNKLRHDLSY
jgi:hypothetical protein